MLLYEFLTMLLCVGHLLQITAIYKRRQLFTNGVTSCICFLRVLHTQTVAVFTNVCKQPRFMQKDIFWLIFLSSTRLLFTIIFFAIISINKNSTMPSCQQLTGHTNINKHLRQNQGRHTATKRTMLPH